jgi:hypothetical protein
MAARKPPIGRLAFPEMRSIWRRGRDSNPRDPFGPNGFQDRRFQPLTHPSTADSTAFVDDSRKIGCTFETISVCRKVRSFGVTEPGIFVTGQTANRSRSS